MVLSTAKSLFLCHRSDFRPSLECQPRSLLVPRLAASEDFSGPPVQSSSGGILLDDPGSDLISPSVLARSRYVLPVIYDDWLATTSNICSSRVDESETDRGQEPNHKETRMI